MWQKKKNPCNPYAKLNFTAKRANRIWRESENTCVWWVSTNIPHASRGTTPECKAVLTESTSTPATFPAVLWLYRWGWNLEKWKHFQPAPLTPQQASEHASLLTSLNRDLVVQSFSFPCSHLVCLSRSLLPGLMMSHTIWFSARIKPEKRFTWWRGEKRRRFNKGCM